ncbi:hypothetical protein RIF29_36108 [Crotalaria pallida]|uniref:K Homology domain-containing protein n=1 Tax=Crotalaria pallida TaxID=3830 RepID=A0AAN9HU54_CROPI
MSNPKSPNPNPKQPSRAPSTLSFKGGIPPGHVTFRILCQASCVGGLIGKSGNVIRSIQQATGTGIRIDARVPLAYPERLIHIVGPGGRHDDDQLWKAQAALVMVFEKLVDVAAEEDGVEVRDDQAVLCRLVVKPMQASSVIGKGGEVVTRIRVRTGCRIRIARETVPGCTLPSDEIISIEGNLSSVKKAIVVVSRQLHKCPPADRTTVMVNRPYEVAEHANFAVPDDTSTELLVDHPLQWSSGFSTSSRSSNCNASQIYSLPAEVNRASASEPKSLQREVTFRLICSSDKVGSVIGKGGSIIRAIQSETGATISVGPIIAKCDDQLVTVTAFENPESTYSPAQTALMLVFSSSIEAGVYKGPDLGSKEESFVVARLAVLSDHVGCLIGEGGAIISEMRKATRASIRIVDRDMVPKCASNSDQVVQVSGYGSDLSSEAEQRTPVDTVSPPLQNGEVEFMYSSGLKPRDLQEGKIFGELSNVQDALSNATRRLRDLVFVSEQNSGATRSLSSVQVTGPHGKLRGPVPLGGQPIDDVSLGGKLSLSQRLIEHPARSGNSDRPSPPGFWEPQTMPGINSRGINNVGSELTSQKGISGLVSIDLSGTIFHMLLYGTLALSEDAVYHNVASNANLGRLTCRSKTAIEMNTTTVEIVVPEDLIGSVYGEKGSNLIRVRKISGAKVTICEPHPKTRDRTVVISGTPEETQAAESLLHAFILDGTA